MLDNSVEIVNMVMTPVKVPVSYRRKTNINVTNKDLDVIGEQYKMHGVTGLTSSFMSKELGAMVSYDQAPTEAFVLPNGNEIERFNFKIITRSLESNTADFTVTTEYIITGYADTANVSLNGVLDDNMAVYFTNISGVSYTQHKNGRTTTRRLLNSEILRNPETDMLTSRNSHMRMTKSDVLTGLAVKQYNSGDLSEQQLMINTLGDNTLLASHVDNNAFEMVAGSVSNYLTSDINDSGLETRKEEVYVNAATLANGGSIITCPFLNKLMFDTGIPGVSSLTWGDLKYSFPDIESKTEILKTHPAQQSPSDVFLMGNDAGAASLLTSTATMAVDLALASMVLYNISTVNFTMSNMTYTGETTYGITGVTTPRVTVDTQALVQMVNKFLEEYSLTSFPALTQNMFNISLSISITQISATVNIEIQGYGTDSIVIPIVTHNLQTPALATMGEYKNNVSSIDAMVNLMSVEEEPVEQLVKL